MPESHWGCWRANQKNGDFPRDPQVQEEQFREVKGDISLQAAQLAIYPSLWHTKHEPMPSFPGLGGKHLREEMENRCGFKQAGAMQGEVKAQGKQLLKSTNKRRICRHETRTGDD